MNNFKTFLNKNIINERESLHKKQEFVSNCWNELRELLLNNNFNVANQFNTIFGRFSGAIIYGKPMKDMKNYAMVYYFGDASSEELARAEGKADISNDGALKANVICTKVNLYGKYDLFYKLPELFPENSIIPISQISLDIFKGEKPFLDKPIPNGEDLLFDISLEGKRVLAHELTHIYDLITHGMKDYSIDKKWHLRHGELEAELISLYDTMKDKINDFNSPEEFIKMYPLTYDGLNMMISHYDTVIGSIINHYKKDDDQKSVNKIYKRLIEIRQKIIDLLKKS